MILEIQNPSDAVTIEADDLVAAGIAIMLVGDGWYGLQNEEGESVFPITAFGGGEAWLKEHGVTDIGEYIQNNHIKMAEILESVLYGHASARALFNSAIAKMSPDDAQVYRKEWNDKKRSSMTNIEHNCLHYAQQLRQITNNGVIEPSNDRPLIFKGI